MARTASPAAPGAPAPRSTAAAPVPDRSMLAATSLALASLAATCLAAASIALAMLAVAGTLAAQASVTDELDAYWADVSRAVAEGDHGAYAATFHPDAVLVSGTGARSYPIARALEAWKAGFDATREGGAVASVEFRFTRRLHDATTAHETGMFRYSLQSAGGEPEVATLHFEALLVRQDDGWKAMMEFQKEPATAEEWEAAG